MKRNPASVMAGILLVLLWFSPSLASEEDDRFTAGYAMAILEREFRVKVRDLTVQRGVITIETEPLEVEKKKALEDILKGLPAVNGVVFVESMAPEKGALVPSPIKPDRGKGTESAKQKTALFDPLLADPHWPHFSASYHGYIDDQELKNVGSTSFGATFSLYRGDGPFGGKWDFGFQAGVFAIFDLDADSKDLLNADYWVALPAISYRKGDLSFLGRLFHQSSHLGDEYLLRSRVDRINLSYEAADLTISYDMSPAIRVYGGSGYMFSREPTSLKPFWFQYGAEWRNRETCLGGLLRPVAALGVQHHEENGYRGDLSLKAGVRIEQPLWVTERYLLAEYFRGRSPNGQFYNRMVEYLGLGVHIYF
jgi:hypothetical protein